MLIDIHSKLRDDAVAELLGQSVFPDPERIEEAIRTYESGAGHELYGTEEEGAVVALAGFTMDDAGGLVIKHIAVRPDYRGKGYGRDLVLGLIELKHPRWIAAETDDEAVGFYRSIGFTIESLGEKYPGVERFKCTYDTTETED
ncbi:GNAT family N-acetyltransferase [Paenibacillus mesophilus]|uniref:GNAT family N-acetyltransferase n=1 Tax=Paenibacillus mesophilus TaxID=2582849 RepID=UPI00110DF0EA|nr:GNAT family N-acetyltransferase [Paenibacillus mesophilus]TMV44999.1 GNAT family N-acetyltransferase [Paenibacillus mesophilus]